MTSTVTRNVLSEILSQARQKRDGELLDVLIKQVVPKAVHLYLGGPLRRDGSSGGVVVERNGGSGDDNDEEEDGFELVSGGTAGGGGGDLSALPPSSQMVAHALKVRSYAAGRGGTLAQSQDAPVPSNIPASCLSFLSSAEKPASPPIYRGLGPSETCGTKPQGIQRRCPSPFGFPPC